MRWVLELVFAVFILGLVFSFYGYSSPHSVVLQSGERGKVAELSSFAVRLATSPDFLFMLMDDREGALKQANREVKLIDFLARVDVLRPVGGVCPALGASRFSISIASVLPNGTAICVVVSS